jgi:hypothetical protein
MLATDRKCTAKRCRCLAHQKRRGNRHDHAGWAKLRVCPRRYPRYCCHRGENRGR